MARSPNGSAEKAIPALMNLGYFSDYYLAHRLDSGLADLYARWDAAEKQGEPTDRTRLRALAGPFGRLRADAALTAPAGDVLDADRLDLGQLRSDARDALLELNDAILDALGWLPERGKTLELTSGDKTVTVPSAHRCDTPTGVLLVALDTVFATDPAAVIASKTTPAGRLVEPVLVNGKPGAHTALDAAQLIFTADDAPSYVLLVSGGAITLLDRDRWGEGISLGANLDDAVARHDIKPKGELAAIAGLFSAGAINPGDEAQSVLTNLLERATTESAGVSKELRHGIRRSVEILANAVVKDVRYRRKGAWTAINPSDLTRQSLRYLYRIIVLLFAEARPELGILPSDDPDYQAGYSMARLRDTALVELHSDHARNARHLQHSLDVLFRLVNDGHAAKQTLDDADDARELTFPGLRSALFGTEACPLVDQAHLSDDVLQQVIANLCFTREKAGQRRRAVSYSTLGINQLGAVYEGLMAYSGFLATEPLYEVDKDADPDNGSWVIPGDRADEFPDEVFLTEESLDGSIKRVRYEEGDFVFRLSGRDRQRSASYYTPEVLTEFTVRHALDVLFNENPDLRAADILNLTVCEPALGSGAFLTEAIAQLAERYLKAAQDESGEVIDADRYQFELQRAKAHFAVNQAYGVDLNQTAVELAEVSLWLSCMHAGLEAPWFGARLRNGNSLVGARRATYTPDQVKAAVFAGKKATPPTDQPLGVTPLGEARDIHHFLVPGQGWGAACDAKEIKELDPDWAQTIKAWRKRIHAKPTSRQVDRLERLAEGVEVLWKKSAREVDGFWKATRQHIDVWGTDTAAAGANFGESAIRDVLVDPRSATSRLRAVMDAWCSLWLWSPQHGIELPSLDEWLSVAEALLRIDERWEPEALFGDERKLPLPAGSSTDDITAAHPWLASTREIAANQTWFHWELEFSPVFKRGGFDLQVGNPPWVRPRWSDEDALAEHDPWFGITDAIPEQERVSRRSEVLEHPSARLQYIAERSENAAMGECLGAVTREPLLAGQQTNLYLLFITGSWRRGNQTGSIALLHPDGHLSDPRAATLRATAYRRHRAHFHFVNELQVFAEIDHTRQYGVNVYGGDRGTVAFTQAAFLYHPLVVDRSIGHDGTGELPGRKLPTGEWDVRPHRERLVHVDESTLEAWAALLAYEDPVSPPVIKTVTSAEANAASAIASHSARLATVPFEWTPGWHEMTAPRDGTIEWRTERVASLEDVILQGPHIGIGNPFFQEPRERCSSSSDYDALDPMLIPAVWIPRTNWQRAVPKEQFLSRIPLWTTTPHTTRWRMAVRKMVPANTARSLFPALIPKSVTVSGSLSVAALNEPSATAALAGMLSSLPLDYFVRVAGMANLEVGLAQRFPIVPSDHALEQPMAHRALRLNCLTRDLAGFWTELEHSSLSQDDFTDSGHAGDAIAAPPDEWTEGIPVRVELDRWLLLTEIDALAALILGVPASGLEAIYRSQFPVLVGYEHQMVFDAQGRQLCGDWHQHGHVQARLEAEAKAAKDPGWRRVWDRVQAHLDGDDGVDLDPFVPPFRPADRVAAMTHAYWTFVDRYGLTPPDSAERPA
jgi:hypothetical protein